MNLIEHFLSELNKVDNRSKAILVENCDSIFNQIPQESLVYSINKCCEYFYSLNENLVINGVDTGLASYGYWILPDGKSIPVNDFQAHFTYAQSKGFTNDEAINKEGWIRVVTDTEFLVDLNILNRVQFNTIIKLLKDHDAVLGYSIFTLGTSEDTEVMYDIEEFIRKLRSCIGKKELVERAEETGHNWIGYWYNTVTKQIRKLTGSETHSSVIKHEPEFFGINTESHEHIIDQAFNKSWVRCGVFNNQAHIESNNVLNCRKAAAFLLKEFPEINKMDVEILNTGFKLLKDQELDDFVRYGKIKFSKFESWMPKAKKYYKNRISEGQDKQTVIKKLAEVYLKNGKKSHQFIIESFLKVYFDNFVNLQENVLQFPTDKIKRNIEDPVNKLTDWIKAQIDTNKDLTFEDILQDIITKANEDNIDLIHLDNVFSKKFGNTIQSYIFAKQIKFKELNESFSGNTALKIRNEIINFVKLFVDTENIVPQSNFDSFENADHIILKISVFNKKLKNLEDIKEKLIKLLRENQWLQKGNSFSKNGISIDLRNISKVFRSGAYKNREYPHLGIAILGPKKPL